MNNRQLGNIGEHIAAEYLTAHGYQIVERNYRSRLGEIDVIAAKNEVLVFVEVKTRTSTRFGRPSEAVNFLKQQKITKVASWYIHNKRLEGRRVRFDVVELLRTPAGQMSVNHIQNAFDAVYR